MLLIYKGVTFEVAIHPHMTEFVYIMVVDNPLPYFEFLFHKRKPTVVYHLLLYTILLRINNSYWGLKTRKKVVLKEMAKCWLLTGLDVVISYLSYTKRTKVQVCFLHVLFVFVFSSNFNHELQQTIIF